MSTKHVDKKSFRPNYVDKMSSTKYAVDLSAVDEVSIDKMSVDKTHCRQMICNSEEEEEDEDDSINDDIRLSKD